MFILAILIYSPKRIPWFGGNDYMKNVKIFPVLLFSAVIILLFIIFIFSSKNLPPTANQNKVCFKESCFTVELATTDAQRTRGLMFRSSLADNQGILFIFDAEGEYPFWMKNTLIPLDIIWLDQNQKVVFISANTLPCVEESCPIVNPQEPAKYVLELNGGVAQKIGLSVGDQLSFTLPDYLVTQPGR